MLKLSKLTDYAVVALVRLAQEDEVMTSPALSQATGIPEPTVAKVLKILAVHDLVVSLRGARGGYRLARPLNDISVARVITAVDGPISLTACVDGGGCDTRPFCGVCGQWDAVNDAIRGALSAITLADMRAHGQGVQGPCVEGQGGRHGLQDTSGAGPAVAV
ncbi:transcriptional regulator, BadM/Rrf2 family [Gluconacetobacter diazotrophicus PA1 5]|uniref:SUF system Fe-S cluster assembly regulator n=2 Tax=Gluconacetobacter diazotrophicus TaxID=33996 RepID=A0A7W4I6I8_GLUDI|nr:SUF system Fe-S cluster assembly regulator [Gluconacetobacter diazotrophicus]ACI53035.1 transcriptional regulator, BadM/Rrf2 family [Gluconacetobacter diazotrophicus PA1 5]MBB2157178.1 SUF system Fe-S cluster assembly regulator [Gluconacetobacter diazotrophicus]TWB07706.1 BadM/Rrf2 family transcriptional regulator [Gluconacetobacter diazotrophicus]CAP57003.1 putative transcriptional regulator, rrf2 family [Gluconacetobacter diazotrophicus PA1 5]